MCPPGGQQCQAQTKDSGERPSKSGKQGGGLGARGWRRPATTVTWTFCSYTLELGTHMGLRFLIFSF